MLIVDNVTKMYDQSHGIKDISLSLEKGKVYSVIGPNGSGKTTLVKCICGILKVDDGRITLSDKDTFLRTTKSQIGYSPDEHELYPDLTICELMDMVNEIKYNGKYQENITHFLKQFNLWNERHMRYKDCSLGMKKKTGLCISFLGDPELVLLDEPTNGIDTQAIITLKSEILRLKEKGSIILITSHVLDFVNKVTDINIFMKRGRIQEIVNSDVNLEEIYQSIYMKKGKSAKV